MVYPDAVPIPQFDLFLRIIPCNLYHCDFPKFNTIITNCCHLYHPYYIEAIYKIIGKCVDIKCQTLVDLNWHRSFGWNFRGLQMLAKANMLKFEDKMRRILIDKTAKV